MESTLDKASRDKLIARIHLLTENSHAQWGKMNVSQMIKHCILWEEMVFGEKTYDRVFIGRIFGKMALNNILKDEKPLRRNTPTIPPFVVKETSGAITNQQLKWAARIAQYEDFTNDHFIHPFFGNMTKAQIGYMAYKHIDHHLRQFGV